MICHRRHAVSDDEAAFEALIDQLLSEGSEDMLAGLKPEASEIG
jgi:hypothetical protein